MRDGYLVYEHYWQGLNQADGHDVRSVTKSLIGTLVGIAVAEGKINSLDQTVGELPAAQLPKDADPRFARVTLKQLPAMTACLAGADRSLGGDSRKKLRLSSTIASGTFLYSFKSLASLG